MGYRNNGEEPQSWLASPNKEGVLVVFAPTLRKVVCVQFSDVSGSIESEISGNAVWSAICKKHNDSQSRLRAGGHGPQFIPSAIECICH